MWIAMLMQMAFLLIRFLGVMIFVTFNEISSEKSSRLTFD
jgi:hypothetical protein